MNNEHQYYTPSYDMFCGFMSIRCKHYIVKELERVMQCHSYILEESTH